MNLITHVQYIAISSSLILLISLFYLIHKKKLKEEYAILWVVISLVFVLFSIWRQGLEYLASIMGISYAPAALFIILFLAIFLILIQFSIIISKQSEMIKNLTQEIGLLKHDIDVSKKDE